MSKRLLARDPALLSEAELSGLVVELARLGGWTFRYHTLRSKGSASGFPDWVFVKGPRLLFVELKSEAGKVSAKQLEWIKALEEVETGIGQCTCAACIASGAASVEVRVWRPSDWDEIVETLTGKRPIEAAA
jgi:hypothetical protein